MRTPLFCTLPSVTILELSPILKSFPSPLSITSSPPSEGGDDKIKNGKGNDLNCGDNGDRFYGVCETDGNGGNDKINSGQGDDQMTGGGGADKFQCGSGSDTITDFDESEGDKASGNCEGIEKGNGNANEKNK